MVEESFPVSNGVLMLQA